MSDFQVPLLASYSVSYQVSNTWVSQVITTFGVLPQDTVKGSWKEKKRQHSTSTVYLSRALGERASKTPSGRPAGFACSPNYFHQKCVEFSSELNGTIERSL